MDTGGVRVTYAGGSYYATGEMLMLRAAYLAQEAGMDSFLVLDSSRTSIDVAYVNSAAVPEQYAARSGHLVRVDAALASLLPIYVEIPQALEAERRGNRRD